MLMLEETRQLVHVQGRLQQVQDTVGVYVCMREENMPAVSSYIVQVEPKSLHYVPTQ